MIHAQGLMCLRDRVQAEHALGRCICRDLRVCMIGIYVNVGVDSHQGSHLTSHMHFSKGRGQWHFQMDLDQSYPGTQFFPHSL